MVPRYVKRLKLWTATCLAELENEASLPAADSVFSLPYLMPPGLKSKESVVIIWRNQVWVCQFCICSIWWGFPRNSAAKESACHAEVIFLGWEDSPGGGHGNPLQYSCLETPHGQSSLVGYYPQGGKESDTTERLSTAQHSTGLGDLLLFHLINSCCNNLAPWNTHIHLKC